MATLPSATRSWTIRQLLWLQVAGAVALLFLVGTVLAINYAAAERRVIEAQRVHVAANLTHLVDRELANIIAALQALAASPAAQSRDFEALRSQAAAAAWLRSLSDIAIVELSGTQLFSSAVPTGQPVPSRPDMGALLPAFEGKIVVSDYAIGVSTQSPIFFVTVPVLRDAGISYVLSAGIKLDHLNGIFAEAGLPADWVSAIVDRNGIFLARSIGADLLVGRPARPEIVSVARSGAPSGRSS